MNKQNIELYSIVQILRKEEKGFSNYHNKYAIVTELSGDPESREEGEAEVYALMFLDSGNENAWWDSKDLYLRGTIDSYKVAKEIIANCKQISKLTNNSYDLTEKYGKIDKPLFLCR